MLNGVMLLRHHSITLWARLEARDFVAKIYPRDNDCHFSNVNAASSARGGTTKTGLAYQVACLFCRR